VGHLKLKNKFVLNVERLRVTKQGGGSIVECFHLTQVLQTCCEKLFQCSVS